MNPWTGVVLNPGNQNSRTDDADRPSDADGAKRGCRVDFVGENSDMKEGEVRLDWVISRVEGVAQNAPVRECFVITGLGVFDVIVLVVEVDGRERWNSFRWPWSSVVR